MAERQGDTHWLNADEVAEHYGVTVEAVHRRMHEGFLPYKTIGNMHEGRPHFHPDRLAEGFPYEELEAVEAGGIVERPDEWLHEGDYALIATRIVRVGRGPKQGSLNPTNIGGNLPRERWRVLGPGDLVAVGETEGLHFAISTGAIAKLPVNRGVLAELFAVNA